MTKSLRIRIGGWLMLASPLAGAVCPWPMPVQRIDSGLAVTEWTGIDVAAVAGQPPVVAFQGKHADGESLWLQRCRDAACSPGTRSEIARGAFFERPRVLLRSSGRPLVLSTHRRWVTVVDCGDAACSVGAEHLLDDGGSGFSPVMALRSDDRAVIAFAAQSDGSVKLHTCKDQACSGFTVTPLLGGSSSPPELRIALTSDDRPVVLVTDFNDGAPYTNLVLCDSPACAAPVFRPIATAYSYFPSLEIRKDDRPVIHRMAGDNRTTLVTCLDTACTQRHYQALAVPSFSMQLDDQDRPVLTVANQGTGLYHCQDEACGETGSFQRLGDRSTLSMASDASAGIAPIMAWTERNPHQAMVAACARDAIRGSGFETGVDDSPIFGPR